MAGRSEDEADHTGSRAGVRKRPKRGCPVEANPGYTEHRKVERTFTWLSIFCKSLMHHERHSLCFGRYS